MIRRRIEEHVVLSREPAEKHLHREQALVLDRERERLAVRLRVVEQVPPGSARSSARVTSSGRVRSRSSAHATK